MSHQMKGAKTGTNETKKSCVIIVSNGEVALPVKPIAAPSSEYFLKLSKSEMKANGNILTNTELMNLLRKLGTADYTQQG